MNFFTYLKEVVILAFLLLFSCISLKSQCGQPDGSIVVSSSADEGVGTLRDAINCANLLTGPNRIIFNIPSNGRVVIQVGSISGEALPSINDPGTVIDASTQPGFGVNGNFEPQIILDGSIPNWDAPINAITIRGDEVEIYGLEIRNFPDDGIDINDANNIIVGDEEKGNVIYNCGIEQDFFPATGNLAPYNGVGIVVSNNAENVEILNNIIGTDYNLSPNLGNEWAGILIRNGSDFALVEANIITDNEIGVRIRNAFGIKISENEMSCNDTTGIELVSGGNDDKAPPVITAANSNQIIGTGPVGNEIEIFISESCGNTPCQGKIFLGRAVVQNDQTWSLSAPFTQTLIGGDLITATTTDNNNRTSRFSDCQQAILIQECADANGVILVTNTNDEGVGSLRAAIECANDQLGPNTIQFNINGGGRQQINVGSTTGAALPFLRDGGTILDGSTQPGFGQGGNFQPLIVLDGSFHDWTFPDNALWVRADNCEVYGLEIRNFPDDGIDVTAGDFNVIGAPNKGNVVYNCGAEKDIFEDDPSQGTWNGCGIVLKNGVQNTTVQGNIVGTDFGQIETIGNELCGIIIRNGSSNNLIGGSGIGEGNIFAYNQIGISVLGGNINNSLLGNSFYCNPVLGIDLSSDANGSKISPTINIASIAVVSGIGIDGESVQVYTTSPNCADGPCQGSTLLGVVTVTNNIWRLDAPFENGIELQGGEQITALATDANGNTSEFAGCLTVSGIDPPNDCSINLGISDFANETCAGDDGAFTLSATNALAPVSYDFGNGSSINAAFSNLSAGTYSVTATDDEGCTATLSVTILQDPTPVLSIVSTINENCSAQDGSFTVLATGGRGPYIYELDNGFISRSPTFSNLAAGNYSVSVIDANNCIAAQSVTLQQTGNINVSIADMREDNCNTSDGSFSLAASGGIAPYSYDLGMGAVFSNEFTNLPAGNYAVTVTDVNNCSAIANISLSGGSAPVTSINNVSQTSCNQPTGSVSISVSGGRAPFSFDIGNGAVSESTFSNLSAGDYEITVIDANNCLTTQAIIINEPLSPVLSIISTQDAACGNANGSVSVLSTGGQAPYTFDIGNGLTSEPNFNSLAEGNYNITVYDDNGCTDQMSITINNSSIPTIVLGNLQNASCNLPNAIVTFAGTGAAPLSYDIGDGPTADPTFSNLAPGTYTVTLTDDNNCNALTTIEITSTGGPQVNVQSTSEARCDKDNGSFSVNAFGGFGPYTYDIGDGPSENSSFTNLPGGNYVVTLTDANGCTATQSVTLGNIPAPTFGIGNIIDASCGESNGSFNVSAIGGLAPYGFSIGGTSTDDPLFTDLSAGTYTVVVTDANNCNTALAVTVEGTTPPSIEIVNQQIANCGQSNGGFDLQVTGGVAPYFFDMGNGESTNSSFRNLSEGIYTVTISDASSCSQVRTVSVDGEADVSIEVAEQLPAACGIDNGAFTLRPSGGQGPYTFIVNGLTYSETVFTNLSAGVYSVQANDANGCSSSEIINITETDGLELEVEVVTNCGTSEAVISVNATQGIAPYTYDLGEGPTEASIFRNVPPGLYQLIVKDANGCESSKSIAVTMSNQVPEASIDIVKQPSCNADDGSIRVNVSVGVPPYIYRLNEHQISPFPTFSNLSSGAYQITVVDAGGCTTSVPLTLGGEASNPIASFDFDFDELEGVFTNTSQSGTSYSWDFGDGDNAITTDANHTFLTEGSYTICLTASNDCGSDNYCETYTIEAVNTNKSFEFDIGEVNGIVGDTVAVPVYVKNFRATVGFQKSVHIVDPNNAKIVGITGINLKDLSTGLFNIKDDQFNLSWFDGNINGFDLPDSTIIYKILVELLADNACTSIEIQQAPLPTQVYKKVGNSEVEVESFKRKGTVCSGTGGTGNQRANISGVISTEDGDLVNLVDVHCTNATTLVNEMDGSYIFEDLSTPAQYVIEPLKNINPVNGVTTFDLVSIQNHILGNTKLDSPYKIIAADANNSGTVSVSDILELRKLLLLDIEELPKNTAWRFVPADYEFQNPLAPLTEEFPETATLQLNSKNLVADFIGIKIGDVNGTAEPNSLVQNESRSNNKSGAFQLSLKDKFLQKGEKVDIVFGAKQLKDILGFQHTIKFDPNMVTVETVVTTKHFNKSNFGESLLDKGYLLVSWINQNYINPGNQEEIFSLSIRAKQNLKLSEVFKISDEILAQEAYHYDGSILAPELIFYTADVKKDPIFELYQNHPNPFAESTVINYQLPKDGKVIISIFDMQGRLLKSVEKNGQKGWNIQTIQRIDLPKGGLYYYQIQTLFGQAMKKMILIDK